MTISLHGDVCSRCQKPAELHPYHLSKVVYRGKEIEFPWLCEKCFMREKEKAWKAPRTGERETVNGGNDAERKA